MEWMMENISTLMWLGAAVLLFILEASTTQFICVWFALGAFVTAIGAALGLPGWGQFVLFVATSGVALLFTRRFVKSVLRMKRVPTNADSVIGQNGTVLVEIDNIAETGRVRVNGLDWWAKDIHGEVIEVGQIVEIKAIEGVKVIVEAHV